MSLRRGIRLFIVGSLAGLAALAFNFLLRLGGIAAFPPESALSAFLRVVPASIEEPMVQQFGDLAGQIGLVSFTLVAAAVYGVLALLYDRLAAKKLFSFQMSKLEGLLAWGIVPWAIFGLLLFPLDGDSPFGIGSPAAPASQIWVFPFTLLLVQGIFAWVLSSRYHFVDQVTVTGVRTVRGRDVARREFIEKGALGVLGVIAAVIGFTGVGQLFPSQLEPTGGGQPIDLQDAPPIFSDSRLATLVDSEVTPNDSFYRVAIDILDPVVDGSGWRLAVDGLVNDPKSYALQDIQALPQASQYTTLECVSNNVNGNLIGNAKWVGTKLSDLLADAGGVVSGAAYVVFYSVDGYSVGIPLAKAMLPDTIVAYSMNDAMLPVKHGYPLRGVVPGLYGMMSAKWVRRISVIGNVFEGYWQTRGWTNNAAIYTETFITSPGAGPVSLSQNGGSLMVAGYAFAGDRGVSKVEVSFDNGATWQEAELKPPLSDLTWALWAYEWKPQAAGEYKVIARATDGAGQVQTSTDQQTFPNGATGFAAVMVLVTN